MVDSYASNFNVNSEALQRSCFTEKHALTESFAALRYVCKSSWSIRYCVGDQTGHTNTTNYCNPAARSAQHIILTYLHIKLTHTHIRTNQHMHHQVS